MSGKVGHLDHCCLTARGPYDDTEAWLRRPPNPDLTDAFPPPFDALVRRLLHPVSCV